jgi:hypothetical protein
MKMQTICDHQTRQLHYPALHRSNIIYKPYITFRLQQSLGDLATEVDFNAWSWMDTHSCVRPEQVQFYVFVLPINQA